MHMEGAEALFLCERRRSRRISRAIARAAHNQKKSGQKGG
jgi:hypothetical protein